MEKNRIPFIDLSYSARIVEKDFLREAASLVGQCRFIGGDPLDRFEENFAAYCGTGHCIGLNSGTDALQLGLLALDVTSEDEVITSPFSFVATAEAIGQVGRLVLADIDPQTFTLSPECVEARVTSRSKVVVPVHIFGLAAHSSSLGALATRHGLRIFEDACQAHGARDQSARAGSLGDCAAFSFYPTKNLGAFGDAGAVTTSDSGIADRIRLLRNHGQTAAYEHVIEGFNSRLDTLQATVLDLKLKHLDRWNQQRRELAAVYRECWQGLGEVRLQAVPEGSEHCYHLVSALVEQRAELIAFLDRRGVDTRVIYPIPIHRLEAYRHLSLAEGAFPNTEAVCASVLSFPLSPGMKEESAERVALSVRDFYEG